MTRSQPLEVLDLIPQVLRRSFLLHSLVAMSALVAIHTYHTRKWETYISQRFPRKPHVLAVLNDWPARTHQIDIHVPTLMHAELMARHHDGTILYTSNMRCATHVPADEQALSDSLNCQPGEGHAVHGRNGHVYHAVSE